jgi:hypothetical protein
MKVFFVLLIVAAGAVAQTPLTNGEKLLRFVNEHFGLDCVQELTEG